MPNTQQARTPTKNASGDAPARHWLVLSRRNVFDDNSSPPSRIQAVQPKSPSSRDSRSKKQRGQSTKKGAAGSTAPSASTFASSAGRHKDANGEEGNFLGADTAPLASTPVRRSQSSDEDAVPAECAPVVVEALQEAEACMPTRRVPRGQLYSAESSVLRCMSRQEHAETGVSTVQAHDRLPVPTHERAVSLSSSTLLSSAALSSEHVSGVAPNVDAMHPATVPSTAAAKNTLGQQVVAGTAANVNHIDSGDILAWPPVAPHQPLPMRFFRFSSPWWQDARTPNETASEDSKVMIQSHARARGLHEEVSPCPTPPRTPYATSLCITPLENRDKEESSIDGEECAVADECSRLDVPTTAGVAGERSQVSASLDHSPLHAVSVLPRINPALYATEELSTATAAGLSKSSPNSSTPPPIPPCLDNREEAAVEAIQLRHIDTANPPRWRRGAPGDDGVFDVEKHTPDAVRGALPGRPQSAFLSLLKSGNATDSSLSPLGKPDPRKRVSPSSGQGPNSSYGCSDGGSTPEGCQTSRLTPYCDTEEEEDARGNPTSGSMTRPLEEGAQEAEQLHRHLPFEDVATAVWLPRLSLSSADSPVTSDAALLKYNNALAIRLSHVQADEPVYSQEEGWQSALQSSHTLLAEYQRSVLIAFMTACKAAWLPSIAVRGLEPVNTQAYTTPSIAEQAPAKGTTVSEVHLLFQLFCTSPSESTADRLVASFFATQQTRYMNWVLHLQFEHLYVRMVALQAVSMIEMHERWLTCMRRDLVIRDAIELFMLLAPPPQTPTAPTRRRIFSKFRMAIHTLSGGGDGNSGACTASAKRSGSVSARAQRKPSSSVAPLSATICQLTADEERRHHLPPRIEPLFSLEQCNATHSTAYLSAVGSPEKHGAGDSYAADLSAVHKTVDATNVPRDRLERHLGTPCPLNSTYSNYCRLVAENSYSGAVTSSSSGLRLPKLIRSTSCTVPVTYKATGETGMGWDKTDPAEMERGDKGGLHRHKACSRPPSSRLQQHREQYKMKKSKDTVLPGGGLRAKTQVLPKRRNRTPPPPPTDTDFVNLYDAEVLERFLK
ncbi:hypothetical protein LPMP_240710 [Leishmania panamensis]|uniref:Uncharacterized protein n=1 Tax=Leishmania panamensis TaxID=5679 RepID=A0A088RU00_LEIPA|nr:hypothetical protein LPMP_240710 [Leishmania panamensis]AIN98704.1 hypothetical protein LPMP_240710 [Leishmania panamensis]